MYRQSYTDQNISSSMQSMPQSMGNLQGYDFRSSSMHYKSPPNHQNIVPSMHQQQQQIYYQSQGLSQVPVQLQQNPYMNMIPVEQIDPAYEMPRHYWREMEAKIPEGYPMISSHPVQYAPLPQMNIVQRISGLVKSQLPMLQSIMAQVSSANSLHYNPRVQQRRQVSKSRSRSRSRQKNNRKSPNSSHDWLCRKCSFSNYDWRDNCKKCNQARPSRSFVPDPQDWKCIKCQNINYARRMECNRCKRPRSD